MTGTSSLARNICNGLYFFLSGAEYAVILPTINGYLNFLGAEQYFLGVVLSAFSLTGLIAAPIFGRISDRTGTSKICVIVGNIFEIGGNFMYFASTDKYMALSSRLIAGIGSGAASSIYGVISRTTTEDERTSAFSKFLLLRQVGLVVGPAFNIFLTSINFTLGPFKVNSLNAPGLLMTVVWVLHTALILILYKDPQFRSFTENSNTNPTSTNYKQSSTINAIKVRGFKDEFLRDEVIVCLTANFLGVFSQAAMETALTPMTKLFFDWGGVQNSYLFTGGAGVVVLGYLTLTFINKCVSDRALLLHGVLGLVGIYVMYTGIFLVLKIHPEQVKSNWVLPTFISSVALLALVLPYSWVAQASIFSKITSIETQAFNQGIRMVSLGIGQIIAPIWGSSLVSLNGLPIMVGVNLFLNVTLLMMIICSYGRLQDPNAEITGTKPSDCINKEMDETSPLLPA